MASKYTLELAETGHDSPAGTPWRKYLVSSNGDNINELWDKAVIFEVDKWGMTHEGYHPLDYSPLIQMGVFRVINDCIDKADRETGRRAMEMLGLGFRSA